MMSISSIWAVQFVVYACRDVVDWRSYLCSVFLMKNSRGRMQVLLQADEILEGSIDEPLVSFSLRQ